MKTAYEVLGVRRDAALIDIEHSYRHLLNAHGVRDSSERLTKEDQRRLGELREAYMVLSSPSRRFAYDGDLQARALRRNSRMRTLHTALAVASLLGGFLLIGAGLHAGGRGSVEAGSTAEQPRATAPTAQASHDDAGDGRHAHN